jgi:S1-C subfamily serine protease
MTASAQFPEEPRPPLLASPRLRVWLALAAVLFLVGGYLLRPKVELATTAAENQPAPILRETVVRRSLPDLAEQVRRTSATAMRHGVRVSAEPVARDRWSDLQTTDPVDTQRFGVVVADRRILAEGADLPVSTPVRVETGDGRTMQGTVIRQHRRRGLAVIEVNGGDPMVPPPLAEGVQIADLVVAVGRGTDGAVAAALFVAGVQDGGVLVTGTHALFRGMPVFSPLGGLVGVLADGAGGLVVLAPQQILDEANRSSGPEVVLGLSLTLAAPATPSAGPVVQVAELQPGGRAAAGGLRSGDILVDVSGRPAVSIEDVVAAMQSPSVVPVRIRRGRRLLSVRLPAVEPAAP